VKAAAANTFEVMTTPFDKLANQKLNFKRLASTVNCQARGSTAPRKTVAKRTGLEDISGASMEHQVEHVARAFYDVQDDVGVWENEPDDVRERFRQDARAAIALLQDVQEKRLIASLQPLLTISPAHGEASELSTRLSDAA
jgi:hypothetical protein